MSAPSPELSTPDQATIWFLDVDGVRLRVSVRGTGSAAADHHRASAPAWTWRSRSNARLTALRHPGHQLRRTRRGRVHRVPRGRGGCPAWPEPWSGLLDALGHDQVDVLGVSFGGVIAQQFAHQSPERVRRLVLARHRPGVVGLGGIPGSPRALLALTNPPPVHLTGLLPPGRRRRSTAAGPHRPGRAAARLGRPVRPDTQPAWVSRAAVRDQLLDRGALAVAAPAAHAGAHRGRRPDHPGPQRADPDPLHSRRPAAHHARRRPPVPAGTTRRDRRPGRRVSCPSAPAPSRSTTCHDEP